MSTTFTYTNDAVLQRVIAQARTRLVFVAPGVREEVADALVAALERGLPGGVSVTLDVDAEVCRLGYGTIAGLEKLHNAVEAWQLRLCHQPGIRLGLVIADDNTLIYSPTPLLLSEEPQGEETLNAIVLTGSVPPAVEVACGLRASEGAVREIGLDSVREERMEVLKADLQANPPMIEGTRIMRVFTSQLHYVEVALNGHKLQTKQLALPTNYFGIQDAYLQQNIKNTFQPFADGGLLRLEIPRLDEKGEPIEGQTELFDPVAMERERNEIDKTYLAKLAGFGVLLRRIQQTEFEQRLARLKSQVDLYAGGIAKSINDRWPEAREKLVAAVLPRVMTSPPPSWKKRMLGAKLDEAEARTLLSADLEDAFKKTFGEYKPTLRWVYKDVTYQSIHDPAFREGLEAAFGHEVANQLFSEHDAMMVRRNLGQRPSGD